MISMASAPGSEPGSVFARRVAMFFAALFLVYGVQIPYLAVWLDHRGLPAGDISVLMAAPFFLRCLVTPAVASFADKAQAHQHVVIILSALTLVLALTLALTPVNQFWTISVFVAPMIIAVSTIMPLTETIAVRGVRMFGSNYGAMRLCGSLSFVAAGFIGGAAIDASSAEATIWLLAGGALLILASAYTLPKLAPAPAANIETDTADAVTPWRVLAAPPFILFLIAVGAIQSAHAMLLTLGALHWQNEGYSGIWIATFWAIAIAGEVAVFMYARVLVAMFSAQGLILIGGAASIVRWVIMAFDPPSAVLLPLQGLHGLTYAATHLGAIYFIHASIPELVQGRAQALYATIASGLAHGSATLLAGYIFARYGGQTYLAMAIIAAIGTLAAVRLFDQRERVPSGEAEPVLSTPIVSIIDP